jgi:hypothetical protein
MNARTAIFLLAILFALPAFGKGAEFEYGPRPSLPVFDPDEFLEPALVKEIAEPLAKNLREEGVDVMVVVLKDIGSAPPEHVARQFAAAWCTSPAHCIVLHVPGNPGSPWIVPAGQVINDARPEQLEQDVMDRERRAKAEPDDPHKVKAAASESADMLRYWMKNALNRSEMIQTESTRIRTEQETISIKKRVAIFGTLASLLPLAALLGVIMRGIRKRGPAYFPNHLWRLRLGAPHAGGNHAVADLGPPMPKP